MSEKNSETWGPSDGEGRPLLKFGPEHLVSSHYVRNVVRGALALPEADRSLFWRCRRSFVARKLWEAGLNEDEVSAALRGFNERARREAEVRRLLMRVEAETAAEGGDP